MKNLGLVLSSLIALVPPSTVIAQSSFPKPDGVLYDAKHKEAKSGIELKGNTLVIRSGIGTPTVINTLAFSRDGSLLAAGKDFGRVVIWQAATGNFLRAIDTGQGIVNAVAISPDDQLIATAGQEDLRILVWSLADGKLTRSFAIDKPRVQSLAFGADETTLVGCGNGSPTFAYNVRTGITVATFPGEWSPVLSSDGKTMMTVSSDKLILRETETWKIRAEIPRPTKSAWPLALDTDSDTYIYGDPIDDHAFIAVRLSSGQLVTNQKFGNLPEWNPAEGGFAAIQPHSGVVFGHSGGRLWAWNPLDGKSCVSPVLYSESGALSGDGSMLAGGIDNSILAPNAVKPGVVLWQTSSILKACEM